MCYLIDIVEDAVFVNVFGNVKFIAVLIAEAEGNTGVYDRLTVENILKKLLGYINIGKHLEVGAPFDSGAGFFAVCRSYRQLLTLFADNLALFKMQLVFIPVAPNGNVHVLGRILRCARAEAVQAEGVFIVFALVVCVFAAGVQLAENKLPVKALFVCVPVQRTAAAEVLDLDGFICIARERYHLAVALACFIYGV